MRKPETTLIDEAKQREDAEIFYGNIREQRSFA